MPKSIWGRRCSTAGCIRPREHDGDCVTNVCMLGENDEMVDEDARENLINTMRSASKANPKMAIISESDDVVSESVEANFAAKGSKGSVTSENETDQVTRGTSVRALHHTRTLDLVMQGLADESTWGDEGSLGAKKDEAEEKTGLEEKISLVKFADDDDDSCKRTTSGYNVMGASKTEPLTPSKIRARAYTGSEITKEACRQEDDFAPRDSGDHNSWLDRYNLQNPGTTPNSQQLIAFVTNRGGVISYKDATALLRQRDRSLTLA